MYIKNCWKWNYDLQNIYFTSLFIALLDSGIKVCILFRNSKLLSELHDIKMYLYFWKKNSYI